MDIGFLDGRQESARQTAEEQKCMIVQMNTNQRDENTGHAASAGTMAYICFDTGEESLPQELNFLPDAARARVERYTHPQAKRESLLAYLLLRRALVEKGKEPLLSLLKTLPDGKPYIEGFPFSLSHCKGASVCCISAEEIGADIEPLRVFNKNFPSSVLDPESLKIFNLLDEKEKNAYLTRQWTQKESYLKLTGQGIRTKLCRLASAERESETMLDGAYIESVFIRNGYWLSMASYQKRPATVLRFVKVNQLLV